MLSDKDTPSYKEHTRAAAGIKPVLLVLVILVLAGAIGILAARKVDQKAVDGQFASDQIRLSYTATVQALAGREAIAFPTVPAPTSVSQDGYTVTIDSASADVDRIVLTYTITVPEGLNAGAVYLTNNLNQDFVLSGPTLMDRMGTRYPARLLEASSDDLFIKPDSGHPSLSMVTRTIEFEEDHSRMLPPTLTLYLTGDLVAVTRVDSSEPWLTAISAPVARNLSFDFSVQVDRLQRSAYIGQAYQVNDLKLILDRVAVTRSETILFMRWNKAELGDEDPSRYSGEVFKANIDIQAGAEHVSHGLRVAAFNGRIAPKGDGRLVLYFPSDLLQSGNSWTVLVQGLSIGMDDVAGEYSGPWRFQFSLPSAVTDSAPVIAPY